MQGESGVSATRLTIFCGARKRISPRHPGAFSQPVQLPDKPASFSDLYGVHMNQSRSIAIPLVDHNEIMAGAIHHLRNAMETGSRRSCAVACMLFNCLAQDETLGTELCEECRGLGECLEGLTEYASWANQP
jgi:hypothetical protein